MGVASGCGCSEWLWQVGVVAVSGCGKWVWLQ